MRHVGCIAVTCGGFAAGVGIHGREGAPLANGHGRAAPCAQSPAVGLPLPGRVPGGQPGGDPAARVGSGADADKQSAREHACVQPLPQREGDGRRHHQDTAHERVPQDRQRPPQQPAQTAPARQGRSAWAQRQRWRQGRGAGLCGWRDGLHARTSARVQREGGEGRVHGVGESTRRKPQGNGREAIHGAMRHLEGLSAKRGAKELQPGCGPGRSVPRCSGKDRRSVSRMQYPARAGRGTMTVVKMKKPCCGACLLL